MNPLPVVEEPYPRAEQQCEFRRYRHRCKERAAYKIYLVVRPIQSLFVCKNHRAFARRAVKRLWQQNSRDQDDS